MKTISYFLFRIISRLAGTLSDQNLYRISKVLKLILFNLIGYRKQVTYKNLTNSFPEKSKKEIAELADRYYQNLSDLLLETLASYYWTTERMALHFKFTNTEILKPYLDKKQRIMAVASHTGNFEIGAVLIPSQVKAPAYSVYRPLANQKLERLIVGKRTRTGIHITPSKLLRPMIEKMELPGILFLLADQNPPTIQKAYWVEFLHQDTAFVHGPAQIAKEYNIPVFYCDTKKMRKGYYESHISLLLADPSTKTHEEITALFAGKLEQSLMDRPDNWLWSHKRWKWVRNQGKIIRVD
jgi:Kdo2-lipid IVA lauroyltransferase/acyltransferase